MIYRVLGLMSGSSLDGLDIAFVEFEEKGGKWTFSVLESTCVSYPADMEQRLTNAHMLGARDFVRLHAAYGHFLGEAVNRFISEKELGYKVFLVCSHGHTVFHEPGKFSTQLGDGATLAALTGLPVVSDLRSMDVALGGQGAPIVPVGEKLLFQEHALFLNIGGIANISYHTDELHQAFDICPANRVLNMISMQLQKKFDEGGAIASMGTVNNSLLSELNQLNYYNQTPPKSLANEFGTEVVYPLILSHGLSTNDSMATYVEHIAIQIANAVNGFSIGPLDKSSHIKLLVTGGGAFNNQMVSRIQYHLASQHVEVDIPPPEIVEYKEALIMALLGVLRWREEETVLSSVTGSSRNSIGGALWMGAH